MSNRKKNQGKKTAPKFTHKIQRLDGTTTVTNHPTLDSLIGATFASATRKTRAFNKATDFGGPKDREHIQWLANKLADGDVMSKFEGEWHQGSALELNEGVTGPGYLRRIIRLKTLGLINVERCRSSLGGYQMVRLTERGQEVVSPVIAKLMGEAIADRDKANAENAAKVAEYRATLSRFTITYPDGTSEDVEGPSDTLDDVLAEVKAVGYIASNIRNAA